MNCQEDWGLCNDQGVHGYPSLVLYPGVCRLQTLTRSLEHSKPTMSITVTRFFRVNFTLAVAPLTAL